MVTDTGGVRMEIALAVIIGIGVGVVVGALGAGGGILAVPVLVILLNQEPHAATASSLVIVGLTAAVSIVHHARRGNVAWRDGSIFAGVSVVGAVVGSRVSVLVPAQVLLVLFGVMLAVIAVLMARRARATRRDEHQSMAATDAHVPPLDHHDDPVLDAPGPDRVLTADGHEQIHGASEPAHPSSHTRPTGQARVPVVVAAALFTGALTGFFGVGGGFVVVPMLVIALGLAMRRASGTSLLVMIVATGVSLLARIGTDVSIDWAVTLAFAAGSMIGGALGGPLSAKARPSTLTWIFAGLLAVVSAVTLLQTLFA